jgi:Spy/CpxP family protein refolding chaperone
MEELDLSSEQKEKIQRIRLEARKQHIAHHAKLQLAQLELHELIEADAPDQKKIEILACFTAERTCGAAWGRAAIPA